MNMAKLTDEELASYAQDNAGEGIEAIIDRYQEKLRRYVGSIVRDIDKTDDVLQETFISIYQNINSFDPDRKFSSWIYRVAHNKAINEVRREKLFIGLDKIKEVSDESLDSKKIEKEIDEKKAKDETRKALDALPLKYKEVILLRYYEDKSYEEISDILRIPKSTVGVRISRGTKNLKRRINIKAWDYL